MQRVQEAFQRFDDKLEWGSDIKAPGSKRKKLDFMKIKNYYASKDTINKVKR